MLVRITNALKTVSAWRLLWMSVLLSEIFSAAIACLMSVLFHGRITHDYVMTSAVTALPVSFAIASLLIGLLDAVRKAEEKAKDERDKTRRYLDRAGFIFLIIGVDQKVITVNEKGAENLGYSQQEIVGRNWFDLFIPERQREEIRAVFRKAISGDAGSVEFYENFVLTKSGAEKLIAWHNTVLTDEQGVVTGTLSSGEDVTGHKKWEDSLQEQEKFEEKLIENSASATFVINPDHRVVLWNKACEELTGVPASGMIGTDEQWKPFYARKRQTLADVIIDGNFEDLAGLYGAYARSVLIKNGLQTQGWYRNLNGKDRYIIFDAAPIYDAKGKLIVVIETLQDITAQKRMENALAESEARLRAIIDTEPECVKLVAADGTILEMNPAGRAMVEADSPEQIVGKSLMPIIAPEHRPAVQAHLERVFNGESGTLEFEIVGLKGTRLWLETRAAPLRSARGEIYALLGVTRDITERKQWVDKLQEQLRFLQLLIDTIPMPVFYKDVYGIYKGCNKAFEGFLGQPKEKIIGKTVYDIAPKELADTYYAKDRELFENPGVQIYDFPVKHSDGTRHEVIFNKATYTDVNGNVAGLLGVIQDITERRQAEEAIRQAYETLNALVNASPLPILVLDPDGNITLWNPAAERVFGWTADEVIGRINPIVPEDKMEEFRHLRGRVLRGEAYTGVEIRRRKKGGSSIDLSLSTAPLRDADGRVSGIVAMLADITDRKKAEQEIQRHYDTQTAINWILNISLKEIPLDGVLQQALDVILSIPWLSFESKGCVFLVEGDPGTLVMKAHRGLTDPLMQTCGVVPLGKCLCGRAAARGEVQYADTVDDRHEFRYGGITPHGHYCVPIKSGHKVLGVVNIYLKEGRQRDEKEIEFLNALASALAGIIGRKRIEEALRESEKRYRTLAEAAHDVIFILDRKGRVQYVNSFGAALFQRTPQEFIGTNVADLFPADVSGRPHANFSKVFETGESLYVENPYSFKNIETWLGTWLVPLKDEDGTANEVLGVSRDITDRKRSEQEREKLIGELQQALKTISQSYKEWQDTFDSITDLIAILDKDYNILKANWAFAAHFGLHPRDVISRKCYEFFHESAEPVPTRPHRTTLTEKRQMSEEVIDKKTNKVFRITTFPYSSPDGEIIGSIHVARDITDEKERGMRLIMSERLAALGQMASGIAHEINNPLASIAGCSEGLLSRVRKGQCDSNLFETYLNIIQEEVFRCKSITTAMLSFVRKTTYEKRDVHINEMLDKTLEIISFQGRLKDVEVARKYDGQMPLIHGNEGELRQVILAVITNALDAMEDKGALTLETAASQAAAVIRITDTGPGIPAGILSRIFDPFFTTKTERGGTGLGLSIARKIVLNHNGNIDVASDPGTGTTFTITLPL